MTRSRLASLLIVIAAALATALGTTAFRSATVPANPAAAQSAPSACPSMTDSITRLYHAFFKREPDSSGFRHWIGLYQSGTMSLEDIADNFLRSSEFAPRRPVSNQAFVNWLYHDVLGPDVVPARAEEWVKTLEGNYPRATAVLTFTESADYVRKTSTIKPLAGYLRWYPRGTHWYCGTGGGTIKVSPLTGGLWADYYVSNRSSSADAVSIWTLERPGRRHVKLVAEALAAGSTDYNWDGAFSGDGDYGRYIEVTVGPKTDWIVVFYNNSLGPDRLGWGLS
jgi:Domain of unknown function (DUF4214)